MAGNEGARDNRAQTCERADGKIQKTGGQRKGNGNADDNHDGRLADDVDDIAGQEKRALCRRRREGQNQIENDQGQDDARLRPFDHPIQQRSFFLGLFHMVSSCFASV